MSEYWVSHKRYFCKYCNIYIADDAPSRRQHEGGLRHKGNVERFVRDLYKTGEKRKHDLEEEKREMAQIEKAANAAFAQDVGSGLVKPGSSSQSAQSQAAGSSKPPRKTDPYADYSTAASLGYVDLDEERLKIEQERRNKEGVVGDWEVVAVAEESSGLPLEETYEEQKPALSASQGDAGRKREAEVPLDDEDTRAFKLRKKKLGVGLGEIYDPGLIPIKLKKKEPQTEDASNGPEASLPVASAALPTSTAPKATAVPKWTARGWDKHDTNEAIPEKAASLGADTRAADDVSPGVDVAETSSPALSGVEKEHEDQETRLEGSESAVKPEEVAVKSEDVESSVTLAPSVSGSLFKKRKIRAGGASNRGRRE